ncbi:hypothetical protein FQA39_LY16545 [Lamprigera yunnana]|nr:hypothetical protein FQA39_LY16545 [Lamprigera yunnana]
MEELGETLESQDHGRVSKNPEGIWRRIFCNRERQTTTFTDITISLCLITPLTVCFWSGTWELLTIYDSSMSFWEVYLFGFGVHFMLAIAKDDVENLLKIKQDTWIWITFEFTCKRFYSYLFLCSFVFYWIANWNLFDKLNSVKAIEYDMAVVDSQNLAMVYGFFIVCLLMLIVLQGQKNILGIPFEVVSDESDKPLPFPRRFRKSMEDKTSLYVLDCLFSVLIIGTLVVFVWRGAWILVDIYLFPEDSIWSSWASLVLGYTIVAIAFMIQPIMRWICDRITGIARLLVTDVFLFFSFLGTVNVWRGIWNLLNIYFLPENKELSAWITHWVCLILLILLKCSNSLLVRGVYVDADEPGGKCVVFPIYYLRLIFQHERAKKISKKFQLEAMTRRKLEMESKSGCTCGMEIKNHVVKESTPNHYADGDI